MICNTLHDPPQWLIEFTMDVIHEFGRRNVRDLSFREYLQQEYRIDLRDPFYTIPDDVAGMLLLKYYKSEKDS